MQYNKPYDILTLKPDLLTLKQNAMIKYKAMLRKNPKNGRTAWYAAIDNEKSVGIEEKKRRFLAGIGKKNYLCSG